VRRFEFGAANARRAAGSAISQFGRSGLEDRYRARMLSDFRLCRRDEITTIPNGHEHVKRWCPHRSPFAAMEENRRPFVCLLGGRACTRRSRCCFPSPELDALKLDIWTAGASGMYFFAIDSSPTTISRRSNSVLLRLSVGDGAVRDAQSSPPTRRCSWKTSAQAYWTSSRRFSQAPRGNKKARLTLPCNPRKLYMVERPLNRQEPRRGSS
jgi:hypothetical protein